MGDRNAAARERVRTYRERKREAGLRLVRYWVPDTRSPEFLAEARRQCLALNASPHAEEDQAWVDAVSGDIWTTSHGMRRSEIWTASFGPDYAGKPRPSLIIQDDAFTDSASVVLCGLTTDETPHLSRAFLSHHPLRTGFENHRSS